MKSSIIGVVDIGTTKVVALIAEISGCDGLRIIGKGLSTSFGMRNGEVVDLTAVSECTRNALAAAEANAGIQMESVYLAIPGDHLEAFTRTGSLSIRSPDNLVPADDIQASNFLHAINSYGLNVEDTIMSSIAVGFMLTCADERQQGVLILDIGGGIADYAMYHVGRVVCTGVIAVGDNAATKFTQLFTILKKQLGNRLSPHHLPCGIILSGGGSKSPGICDLATSILGVDARCVEIPAFVTDPELRQPEYSTALGLLCYAARRKDEQA